jgi:hypothetical protein
LSRCPQGTTRALLIPGVLALRCSLKAAGMLWGASATALTRQQELLLLQHPPSNGPVTPAAEPPTYQQPLGAMVALLAPALARARAHRALVAAAG